MRLGLRIYWAAVLGTVLLSALSAIVRPAADTVFLPDSTLSFALRLLAVVCAVAAWGAAVAQVTRHRVVWPLGLSTATVVVVSVALALARLRGR